MTESTPVTVADKRAFLKANGFDVGSRGKLSAEAEQKYAELQASTVPAEPEQGTPVVA